MHFPLTTLSIRFFHRYRFPQNPSGPSSASTPCPRVSSMGIFENNVVHSQGTMALLIHEDYFPTKSGL